MLPLRIMCDNLLKRDPLNPSVPIVLQLTLDRMRDDQGRIDIETLWNVSRTCPAFATMATSFFWSSQVGLDNLVVHLPQQDTVDAPPRARLPRWKGAMKKASLITDLTLDLNQIGPGRSSRCTVQDLELLRSDPSPSGLFHELVRLCLVLVPYFDVTLLQPFFSSSLEELFVTVDSKGDLFLIQLCLMSILQGSPYLNLLSIDGSLNWLDQHVLATVIRRLQCITDLRLLFPSLVVLQPLDGHNLRRLELHVGTGNLDIPPRSHVTFPLLHTLHLCGEGEQLGRVLELLRLPCLLRCHVEVTIFRSCRALHDVSTRLGVFRTLKYIKLEYFNTFRRGMLRVGAKDFFPLAECLATEKLAIIGYEAGWNMLAWAASDLTRLTTSLRFLDELELHTTSVSAIPDVQSSVCSLADLKVLGRCRRLRKLTIGVDMTRTSLLELPTEYDQQGLTLSRMVLQASSRCPPPEKDSLAMTFLTHMWPNAILIADPDADEEVKLFCEVYDGHLYNL